MKIQLLAGAIMGVALLSSCQNNGYRIDGSGEALKDGDTLFLTTNLTELTPSDTIVVKNGKFSITGETDSTYFCLLYSARENTVAMPFFVEPGTIKMTLPAKMEGARVSGTVCNNEWQIVNDTMTVLSKEMNQLAMQMYSGQLNMEEQARKQGQMDALNERFKQFIYKMGKKNISNEFGYFIVTFYSNGLLSPEVSKELIQLMPDAFRQRKPIKEMEKMLKLIQNTSENSTINDFSMNDMNGKPLSIMDEVKKNKLTVLDFWASWCGPCRQAMPQVVNAYNKYRQQGLGIIGISLDEDKTAWTEAVKSLGMTWVQVSDLQGWNNAAAQAFGVRAIPHMIVVDQEGRIVKNGIYAAELEAFCADRLK